MEEGSKGGLGGGHIYHVLDYNSTSFLQWLSKTHLVRFLLQLHSD